MARDRDQRGRGRPSRDIRGDDTRAAILDAAREMFSSRGFDRTTIRAIAAAARVDPALVHHYFGTKDGLLVEALRPRPDFVSELAGVGAEGSTPGRAFVFRVLRVWEDRPEARTQMIALMRVAFTRDEVARRLRETHLHLVTTALGDEVAADHRALRLALIGSQVVGLAISRYILCTPGIADADPAAVAAIVGPAIDRYLRAPVEDLPTVE